MSKIIFVGDSVTLGCLVTSPPLFIPDAERFYHIIGVARGFTTILNHARNSATVSTLQANFYDDVISEAPDHVGIMIGLNDVVTEPPTPLATFKTKLAEVVQSALDAGIKATLFTPNVVRLAWAGTRFPAYLDAIEQVALEKDCAFVDIYSHFARTWLGTASEVFSSYYHHNSGVLDEKHPSAGGHALIASIVLKPQYARACAL